MVDAVPDWCEVQRGTGVVLLVAPHGGRRPRIDPTAPPANLRVNDVYTVEVTRELGKRLGAGWIANHGLDRNDLDLNRLSQVRRRAPWLLEVLAREVEAIVKRHGRAEVLFIHGWNNGQLKCDIGLGACEVDDVVTTSADGRLTVSEDYLGDRVRSLRAALQARGICAPIGEKYPASHPNNVLQLFAKRARNASDGDGAFASLARSEAVDALQLELSLPLRCPGEWRERFLDSAVAVFGEATDNGKKSSSTSAAAEASARRLLLPRAEEGAPAESLQFYDPAADLGIFTGVGRMGPKSVGGRLLIFLGGQRIALFTGEEVASAGVPPLHVERRGHCVSVRFHGPILVIEDAAEYLDLEAALAASTTVEAELAVDFEETGRATGVATFGRVRGELAIDGRRHALDVPGFGHVAALRSTGAAQTMLAASFGTRRALVGRLAAAGGVSSAVHFNGDAAEPLRDAELLVVEDGDAYTPAGFELRAEALPLLRVEARSRMAILRSGPHGYVRVAFGVARFSWDGLEGHGLYEHALPLPALTPT